jgi:hypothetical protein
MKMTRRKRAKIMMGSPVTLTPTILDLANNVISLVVFVTSRWSRRASWWVCSERDLIGAAANRIFGLNQKSKSALLNRVGQEHHEKTARDSDARHTD